MWKLWYLNRRFIGDCRNFGSENHKLFLTRKSNQGKLLWARPSLVKDGRANPGRFQLRLRTNMLVHPLWRLDDPIWAWFTRPSFHSTPFSRTSSYGRRNVLVTPSISKWNNFLVASWSPYWQAASCTLNLFLHICSNYA